MSISKKKVEKILEAIRKTKIPDEHWVEFDKMIDEQNKKFKKQHKERQLSDEDWHKRFTI